MENQLTRSVFLFRSMGFSYWVNRIIYEIKKRSFLYRRKFPLVLKDAVEISLEEWIKSPDKFFFDSKDSLVITKNKNAKLRKKAEQILNGNIQFFNGVTYNLGLSYDWLTDPTDGYRYNGITHWTKIKDFSAGRDIKYVWEKSRFCYLYTIIRYDYHFEIDCSEFVISEIISWIDHAPLNCGPNYISSQEIGLRIMNWCFFLTYYKNTKSLTEKSFQKIVLSIQGQATHIYNKLEFSQKFVRNNHILTEAAALITVSILFPSLPQSAKWKKKALFIFEKEINYQIYDDGTYLQYSMNYNRVVVQLLSWVIGLSAKNGIELSDLLKQKANKTISFLFASMNPVNGKLPNYGNNDGSLFFPLNDQEFSDYRPQLQLLNNQLSENLLFDNVYEDTYWFSSKQSQAPEEIKLHQPTSGKYHISGYYLFRDQNTFTFLRCGNHKHRPSQADNLHLDLWFEDQNIMRDAGTFQYNGAQELNSFYFGTRSHNTIQIGNLDQMLKGERFIWYYRTSCIKAEMNETETEWHFTGSIKAFRQTGKWIMHKREVTKKKNIPFWEITDTVSDHADLPVTQIWNPSAYFYNHFEISAVDENGNSIQPDYPIGYFSETYGIKEEIKQIHFTSKGSQIKTIISPKTK